MITRLPQNKMAIIAQTTFPSAFDAWKILHFDSNVTEESSLEFN